MEQDYQHKVAQLVAAIQAAEGNVGLAKTTSNLFRQRQSINQTKLDVGQFTKVIRVDSERQEVEVEGMCTYEDLVDGTLAHQVMPCVVPQLKTITIGGAVSGIGIESTSFRYGLPHETITEMDVLLGHGEVVTCRANNDHSDLFFAMPNSYGTLGYVLKLKAKTIPVKPYVELQHIRHSNPTTYFAELEQYCQQDVDFVDGCVFSQNELYLSIGRFTEHAPWTSDYTWRDIYYRSISQREQDYLSVYDYLWRWDTDWFWCSKNLGMQQPILRRLAGKKRLNSRTYSKIMRWNSRYQISQRLGRIRGQVRESVIQDVDIPSAHAVEFLAFLQREICIKPIWICPLKHYDPKQQFDLYQLDPGEHYINFGFWDTVASLKQFGQGHFNRKVTRKVFELGGIQSLYSTVYMEQKDFEQRYNGARYQQLKQKYDPQQRLRNLYQKVILSA